jgi:threonine/homoserine/homoserine lactone efflux protein
MIRLITAFIAMLCMVMTMTLLLTINEQPEWLKWAGFGWLFLSMFWMWKMGLSQMFDQEETSWESARIEESKLVRYSSPPGRRS